MTGRNRRYDRNGDPVGTTPPGRRRCARCRVLLPADALTDGLCESCQVAVPLFDQTP